MRSLWRRVANSRLLRTQSRHDATGPLTVLTIEEPRDERNDSVSAVVPTEPSVSMEPPVRGRMEVLPQQFDGLGEAWVATSGQVRGGHRCVVVGRDTDGVDDLLIRADFVQLW
jgi:hypothetical protein